MEEGEEEEPRGSGGRERELGEVQAEMMQRRKKEEMGREGEEDASDTVRTLSLSFSFKFMQNHRECVE